MDKAEVLSYLEAIDVAGPYSRADMAELRRVAASVGLPINPDETYSKNHIEWISAGRLIPRAPDPGSEVLLWRGRLPPPFSADTIVLDNLLTLKGDMALWMENS